jgi:hypothetical protein
VRAASGPSSAGDFSNFAKFFSIFSPWERKMGLTNRSFNNCNRQAKSGMAEHTFGLVAPRPSQPQQRHGILAVLTSALLISVIALVTTNENHHSSVLEFTPDTKAGGQETAVVTKFYPDEDLIGDNGGTSDYGITNDYQQDSADKEVHDFVTDNTDALSGELHADVPTRDMMAVQSGNEVIQDFNFTDFESIPPSPKDAIIDEVADDPLMRFLENREANTN